ncbi:hypothetical protein [Cryptosporangium sp. NPDC051539]|uniref:hypothetical protein n=1 Tax=Cryptosporangium sp. NPDC051539 TaxID=3363962 RepID=UPI0037A0C055
MPNADFSSPKTFKVYTRDLTHRRVVAYVGLVEPAELPAWLDAVHDFADRRQLGMVEAVYRDTGPKNGNLYAGFDAALRDLASGRAHGVIVPDDDTIATDQYDRRILEAWVRAAGGVLYPMESATA